jgi:hypothetical protein
MPKRESVIMKENTNHHSVLEMHRRRLRYLELWWELAIRPPENECHPDDLPLLQREVDDCSDLMNRCLDVRKLKNDCLPPHDVVLDDYLFPDKSSIANAGLGLYFRNPSSHIQKGQIICYMCGHIHNFHSSQRLQDSSYLLHVSGEIFVDAGPLPQVKARYINDPLNEDYVNCKFVPEPSFYRCAVIATRDIECGEELFVSYGEAYWSNGDHSKITIKY